MKDRSAAQALLAWRAQTGYREPQLDALVDALQAISGGADTRPRP